MLPNPRPALALALLLAGAPALGQTAQFSAEMVVTMSGEAAAQIAEAVARTGVKMEATQTMKIYVSGMKMRMESGKGPQETVIITDGAPQGGKTWYIQVATKTYREMDNQAEGGEEDGADLARYLKSGGDLCKIEKEYASCKKGGTAEVGGRSCTLYEVVEKDGSAQTLCMDVRLHYPLRVVTKDATTELRKVKEGPQPGALFALPPGLTRQAPGG